MKFGIFYEHQLPRPWGENAELQLFQGEFVRDGISDWSERMGKRGPGNNRLLKRSTRMYAVAVRRASAIAMVDFPVAGRPPITTITDPTARYSHLCLAPAATADNRRSRG